MEIASPHIHRVMVYLAELHTEGHAILAGDLDAFGDKPDRIKPRGLGESFQLTVQFLNLVAAEGEPMTAYLERVGWVLVVDGKVHLTPLGLAVEKALSRRERRTDEIIDTVLDKDDPLVIGRLVERISKAGPGLLVDPYFRLDQLHLIMFNTEIDRVLTSVKAKTPALDGMRAAMQNTTWPRSIEIRVGDASLHDRYVITEDGSAFSLGASLNGIGSVSSVMTSLNDAAEPISDYYESVWSASESLLPDTADLDHSLTQQPDKLAASAPDSDTAVGAEHEEIDDATAGSSRNRSGYPSRTGIVRLVEPENRQS